MIVEHLFGYSTVAKALSLLECQALARPARVTQRWKYFGSVLQFLLAKRIAGILGRCTCHTSCHGGCPENTALQFLTPETFEPRRTRTCDPKIKSLLLYQLS
jgi:hypothetical protein